MMIPRISQSKVEAALARQAAVALIGPRQVGKTTLAHEIAKTRPSIYLDLEAAGVIHQSRQCIDSTDVAVLKHPRDHPDEFCAVDNVGTWRLIRDSEKPVLSPGESHITRVTQAQLREHLLFAFAGGEGFVRTLLASMKD